MLRPKKLRRPSGGWDPVPTTILISGWTGLDSSRRWNDGALRIRVVPEFVERHLVRCLGRKCLGRLAGARVCMASNPIRATKIVTRFSCAADERVMHLASTTPDY